MKSISLHQRTLIGLAAITLGLGGTLEIASAATTSSTRNLEQLTSSRLVDTTETTTVDTLGSDSELVAFKFKKRHGRKFKKFKKHYGHKSYKKTY